MQPGPAQSQKFNSVKTVQSSIQFQRVDTLTVTLTVTVTRHSHTPLTLTLTLTVSAVHTVTDKDR